MLKRIIYFLFPSVFLLLTATAYGQIDSSSTKQIMTEKRASVEGQLKDKREKFKEQLEAFKDKKRQALLTRIDEKITNINKRRTSHMVKVLDKLSSIRDRLDSKIASASAAGKDVTTAQVAIEKANDTIATAQSTVSSQAGKEYVINMPDEGGVKAAVGSVVNQLQQDLRATHKIVVDAKQAVMSAAKEVAKLKIEKEKATSTNSAETQE